MATRSTVGLVLPRKEISFPPPFVVFAPKPILEADDWPKAILLIIQADLAPFSLTAALLMRASEERHLIFLAEPESVRRVMKNFICFKQTSL